MMITKIRRIQINQKQKRDVPVDLFPMETQEMAWVPVQILFHYVGITQYWLQKLECNAIKKDHIAITLSQFAKYKELQNCNSLLEKIETEV